MTTPTKSATEAPDPAAVFSCALSLWTAAKKRAVKDDVNLSDCYNGMDQFMREVMRIATQFEEWSCRHIDFENFDEVWPYTLEDRFGETCLGEASLKELAAFDESDCLRIAMRLGLPIIVDGKLPVPVDVSATNPVPNSPFKKFRIQTIRDSVEDEDCEAYTSGDEPFDAEFGPPYFGLYGVDEEGLVEFIAERQSYEKALELARKLAPGINFPESP